MVVARRVLDGVLCGGGVTNVIRTRNSKGNKR